MIILLLSTMIIEYGKETQKFSIPRHGLWAERLPDLCGGGPFPRQGSGGCAAFSWRCPAVRVPAEIEFL